MIKIRFLGTSGSTPTRSRALPSVLIEYNGSSILLDCGEGTQLQMLRFNENLFKIRDIFITHEHGDHLFGLPGIIRTLAINNINKGVNIYIPKESYEKIDRLLDFDANLVRYKVNIVKLKPLDIVRFDGFYVKAFKLKHSVPTLGYAFVEYDRLRFYKDKIARYRLTKDDIIKIKSKGYVNKDNKIIKLDEVTYLKKGKKIVYATDTRPFISTVKVAKDADLLIHESSYSSKHINLARERLHSTAAEAAKVALRADVNKLILFHFSARYKDIKPLLKEASSIFSNTQAAYDGLLLYI
ncbi:MAG: ribonuclease Z [Candidatus Micrarchaeota archaeon]|nr:MAG: ribonuclease Z [Candidatus Micrarchaeota archaeon]